MDLDISASEKTRLSKIKVPLTLGFIYWVLETHNARGLKNQSIQDLGFKLLDLQIEYKRKYPDGLTGFTE